MRLLEGHGSLIYGFRVHGLGLCGLVVSVGLGL